MNLNATTPQEALDSIADPILRQIKEIDYNAKCNPTSFYTGVMGWFKDNNPDCKVYDWLNGVWAECLERFPWTEQVADYSKAKKAHLLFRFWTLHRKGLITLMEYEADWMKQQEKIWELTE